MQFVRTHQAKLAAVSALVGMAAYVLLPKLLPSLLKKKARDPSLLPALTEEEVLRVMNKVFDKLKIQAARMVSAAENIRAQFEQQGQQIDDEKLMRHFILPNFETAMADVQAKVFEELDVDEDEVDDAKTFYLQAGACATRLEATGSDSDHPKRVPRPMTSDLLFATPMPTMQDTRS